MNSRVAVTTATACRPPRRSPNPEARPNNPTTSAPPAEQVVDELTACRDLRADQRSPGQLESFGQFGDGIVDGAEHDFAGRDHGSRIRLCRNNSGELTPQAPSRGEIQIEQGSQGDTLLRRFFTAGTETMQLTTLQRLPLAYGDTEDVQEITQQFDG